MLGESNINIDQYIRFLNHQISVLVSVLKILYWSGSNLKCFFWNYIRSISESCITTGQQQY